MTNYDYIAPAEVVKVRIFFDRGETDGMPWNLDGRNGQGGYTEACARFATWAEALSAIPEFLAGLA